MKERVKCLIIGILIGALLMPTVFASVATITKELHYDNIKITYNDSQVRPTDANGNYVEPFIIDGTTYLPVRGVANALGLYVDWDGTTKTVKLSDEPIKIETPKVEEEIPTLVWYVPGEEQPDTAKVMKEANKIVEKEIGARIDLRFLDSGDFDEKMRLKMASGYTFDLCFTGYINVYSKAAKMGGLEPLDELLKLTPDLVKATPDFFWDAAKVDGKIYAVPNQQIVAAQKTPFIPKRLANKYNLNTSAITQYSQLEPFMKNVYENEKGTYPWRNRNAYFKVGADYEEIIGIGVGIEKGKKGNVKVVFTDELQPTIDGINMRNQWYMKGYIRPDVLSATDDYSDYVNGRYAIDIQTYKPGVEENIKAVLGEEVVACKNISEPYIGYGSVQSTMIGIGRNSKHKEKAIKFIELINTNKELYNLFCFGIKGQHYTLTKEGLVQTFIDSRYAPMADWKFGNQFNALVRDGAPADIWEQTKKMNDRAAANGDISPILGFTLDRTNIERELSALTKIRAQYATPYFVGVKRVDAEYWDYIDRMYDAGLQKVLDEVQRQVNEHLAKNR